MLIIALVLAVVGLAALVFAVVTSNALVAWVCIGASALGVVLLMVDAVRERRRPAGSTGVSRADAEAAEVTAGATAADDAAGAEISVEDTYENFDAEPDHSSAASQETATETAESDAPDASSVEVSADAGDDDQAD